jgi:predicted restriction endonuclease
LAILYGVETKNLNKAVKRNIPRFPDDFMFQLSESEAAEVLRFQSGTSKSGRGGRRTRPYAFTQEGIAMLSGVLHGERSIQVNIEIMRTFVKLRCLIDNHRDLAQKLAQLESKYDRQFKSVFEAIRELMSANAVPRKRIIGFSKEND